MQTGTTRKGRGLRAVLWFMLILAGLWAGYWWVGSGALEHATRAWFADQAARSLIASNESVAVEGFPNRFDLTVTGLHLADPTTGLEWTAPFVQVFSMTWKPWHLIAALPSRQELQIGKVDLIIENRMLRASLLIFPGPSLALNELVIEAEMPKVSAPTPYSVGAEKLVLSMMQNPSRANFYRSGLLATDVFPDSNWMSELDLRTDLPEVIAEIRLDAQIGFSAALNRFSAENPPRLVTLEVTDAHLLWGPLKVFAHGSLTAGQDGLAEGEVFLKIEGWRQLPQVMVALGLVKSEIEPAVTHAMEIMAESGADPEILVIPLKMAGGIVRFGLFPIGPAPRFDYRQYEPVR